MKNALIAPNQEVYQITGWKQVAGKYEPITAVIPNAQRVAEVADQSFDVAPPLFWVECADNVVADQFYYDSVQETIIAIPAPPPVPQPTVTGAQTL